MDNSIQAHQKELCNKLWAMANALRGNMEAYEFKNYGNTAQKRVPDTAKCDIIKPWISR